MVRFEDETSDLKKVALGICRANACRSFRVLQEQSPMAHLEEETSNAQFDELFENLADWNEQLKHIDFHGLDDPQAQSPSIEFEEPQP